MKRLLFLVLLGFTVWIPFCLLGTPSAMAQENHGLRVGERLEYGVSIKGIPVGEQVLTVKAETEYQGHPAYLIEMELRNYAAFSLFISFHEKDVLYLQKETLLPLYVRREVKERKKTKTEEVRFLFEQKQIEFIEREEKKVKQQVFSMDSPCLENLSLVYYLRIHSHRQADKDLLLLTSRGPRTLNLVFDGIEEVSSPYKKTTAEKIIDPDSEVIVWVSQDSSGIPIAIRATKKFGTIDARLVSVK